MLRAALLDPPFDGRVLVGEAIAAADDWILKAHAGDRTLVVYQLLEGIAPVPLEFERVHRASLLNAQRPHLVAVHVAVGREPADALVRVLQARLELSEVPAPVGFDAHVVVHHGLLQLVTKMMLHMLAASERLGQVAQQIRKLRVDKSIRDHSQELLSLLLKLACCVAAGDRLVPFALQFSYALLERRVNVLLRV